MLQIALEQDKKIYFASDLHLGLYPLEKSVEREKLFIKWLDEIKHDAQVLFLLGDIFDFWYEYRKVIPKGFTRFLGKLCELADSGIEIHFFTGNHDVWVFDYLPREIGLTVHSKSIIAQIDDKSFYLGHGDDVNHADIGFRILKACFTSPFLQFLFSRLHPNLAYTFGHWWSKKSRYSKGISEKFLGIDKEHQIVFARKYLQNNNINYFVFGHRHYAMDIRLNDQSRLINLGEWIASNTYSIYDGKDMILKSFTGSPIHKM